eukprot:UN25262
MCGDECIWQSPTGGLNTGATQTEFQNRGLWNGSDDWSGTFDAYINANYYKYSLRSGAGYLIRAPQEYFAGVSNVWYTDTLLTLPFAIERSQVGYFNNMD